MTPTLQVRGQGPGEVVTCPESQNIEWTLIPWLALYKSRVLVHTFSKLSVFFQCQLCVRHWAWAGVEWSKGSGGQGEEKKVRVAVPWEEEVGTGGDQVWSLTSAKNFSP